MKKGSRRSLRGYIVQALVVLLCPSLTSLQNKELEVSEERKRKAKQLEMQRKEVARRNKMAPRAPSFPSYTPPARPSVPDASTAYEAEKTKTFPTKYALWYQCLVLTSLMLLTVNNSHPVAKACNSARSPRPQICTRKSVVIWARTWNRRSNE